MGIRHCSNDSLLVGVPAVASGVAVLVTKLLPTLGLIFLLVAAWFGFRDEEPNIDQAALVILFGGSVTLAGFLFRQWTKLKNRRLEYLKKLADQVNLSLQSTLTAEAWAAVAVNDFVEEGIRPGNPSQKSGRLLGFVRHNYSVLQLADEVVLDAAKGKGVLAS